MIEPHDLEVHVRTLAEKFAPRDYEHIANLNRTADYIKKQLFDAGGRMEEQSYFVDREQKQGPFRNIIASFGPSDGERIIIGAHYDSCGPYPAADDNASGVAGLIELARLLKDHPPAVRTDLVAYTLEEPPFFRSPHMGSAVHADSLKKEGIRVRGMICLEMIGYFSDEPKSQSYPMAFLKLFYPTRGHFITVVGGFKDSSLLKRVRKAMRKATPLPVQSLQAPAWLTGVDFSDHRSYWKHGYPAVMITDTAFFRNERYHTPQDTPDTLDYRRMALVVEGVFKAVQELSVQ